ncbi:hypothetical protein, partial [Streptomyces sp. NPDC090029]|uniref:hypothetical protein n=1 Tax=Streptomyces sp. NPDC090029 TaxID=3365924 RepID=UPI0038145AF6
SWCKTSTEFSGRAVGDEAENPTARAVGIPLLHEGEEVNECNPNGQWGWLPDAPAITTAFADILTRKEAAP